MRRGEEMRYPSGAYAYSGRDSRQYQKIVINIPVK
jgi:hypothetical protein